MGGSTFICGKISSGHHDSILGSAFFQYDALQENFATQTKTSHIGQVLVKSIIVIYKILQEYIQQVKLLKSVTYNCI